MLRFKILVIIPFLITVSVSGYAQRSIESAMVPALRWMQAELFLKAQIDGQGVRIAVLDAGFPGVDTEKAFEHLRVNKQLVKTWNFVKGDEHVYRGHPHGTAVLSCIAGMNDTLRMGMATGAQFLLAVTEVRGEPAREERYFAQAVEWAVENGAQIIHSSLGYTYQRYFSYEMDGKSSIAARAVSAATKKGVLFITSLGNEGSSKWRMMGTPADAEMIISVGGVDPETLLPSSFTSRGPTMDGRIKPDLVSAGTTLTASPGRLKKSSGTSFAAPLVTGFAACMLQLRPNLLLEEMIQLLKSCGHLYPYYDYAHGYGIPMASRLIHEARPPLPTFYIESVEAPVSINIPGYMPSQTIPEVYGYIYYHVKGEDGRLTEYGVIRAPRPGKFELRTIHTGKSQRLGISFNGYSLQN